MYSFINKNILLKFLFICSNMNKTIFSSFEYGSDIWIQKVKHMNLTIKLSNYQIYHIICILENLNRGYLNRKQ